MIYLDLKKKKLHERNEHKKNIVIFSRNITSLKIFNGLFSKSLLNNEPYRSSLIKNYEKFEHGMEKDFKLRKRHETNCIKEG